MTSESTAGRSAARALAAKTPGWMVWYGERTGSFWAVPRAATRIVARLLEAPTPGDLEEEIMKAEGRSSRQAAPEQPGREQPERERAAREQDGRGGGDAPRHRRATADPQAPRIPVNH
ncbi:hypothetical protein [Microbispora sp. H10670]|uniref:hypothetical protein n=1 Tax=Microbispora sp. H10670 TaxID=2729108 RepID=UPI001603BDF1|nr:hypothetical protein [Microbispora sp. H10670]